MKARTEHTVVSWTDDGTRREQEFTRPKEARELALALVRTGFSPTVMRRLVDLRKA